MITEDVAGLIAQPGTQPELGFHTGRIISWDLETGANTVEVAGSPIPNIAMLNIGDTVKLGVGDTVGVIRFRSTYFILGRIIPPESPEFASESFAFDADYTQQDGFTITTTGVEYAQQNFVVPAWVNRIMVHATVDVRGRNSTAGGDAVFGAVLFNGIVASYEQLQHIGPGETGGISASWVINGTYVHTGPTGSEFTIGGRIRSNNASWTADSLNSVAVSTSVVYRRE